jgi:TP901 family phage tail tape measure protein
MAEVASAFVSLMPSAKGFGAKLDKQIGGDVKSSGSKMGKLFGAAMIGAAVGGVALIGKFTKDAAVLDTKMREVVTLFGETGKAADRSLGVIQKDVKNLSNEFGIAQETLTGGLYQAISSGVPRENAFTFMQVASKASIGGVTDVETAVDGLTTTINAFGLKASDAQAVSDSMFTAVKGGKTNFEQLSASLFNVAPAAAAAGVSFQEVNAAIATLTAGGTPTSVATTQIRAALTGLQKPSKELDAIFGDLGYANAQVAIESKGLGFALDAVKKASKGNNGELQKLLGSSEAVAAANVLAGTGAKKFNDELKAQKNAAGATNDAFDVVNKGVERQFAILKTNLTNVGLSIGQAVLPVVNQVLTAFNNMGPVLSRIGAFLAPFVERIKALFAGLSTGGGGAFFAELSRTGAALGGVIKALLPTLQAIGSSIIAVVVPAFREIAALVQAQLLPAFRAILPVVTPVVKFLLNVLGAAVVGAIKGAVQVIKGLVNVIAGVFKLVAALVKGDWQAAWNAVKQIVSGVINAVIGAIKVWFNVGILAVFKQGIKALLSSWTTGWNAIKSAGTTALNGIRSFISGALNAIVALFRNSVTAYLNLWKGLFNTLRTVASAGWNALRSAFGGALAAIRTVVATAMGAVKNAFTSAWSAVKNSTVSAWNAVKGAVSSGVARVLGLIRALPGQVRGALGSMVSTMRSIGTDMIRGLIGGITGMASAAADAAKNVVGSAVNAAKSALGIASPSKVFKQIGEFVGKGFINGLVGTREDVRKQFADLMELVNKTSKDGLANVVQTTRTKMLELAGEYTQTITKFEGARDKLQSLLSDAASLRDSVSSAITGTGNVTGFSAGTDEEGNALPLTLQNIMTGLRGARTESAEFLRALQQLKAQGLNKTAISDIVAAGPAEGLAAARAILDADSDKAIKRINKLQREITTSGDKVANLAANSMYKAGIDSARGLIRGLEGSEQKLTAQIRRMAQQMVATLKAELGIKSPSRVMFGLGGDTGEGFRLGVAAQQPAVDTTMARLVSPPTLDTYSSRHMLTDQATGDDMGAKLDRIATTLERMPKTYQLGQRQGVGR